MTVRRWLWPLALNGLLLSACVSGALPLLGTSDGGGTGFAASEIIARSYTRRAVTCVSWPDPVPHAAHVHYQALYRRLVEERLGGKSSGLTVEAALRCALAIDALSCDEMVSSEALPAACRIRGEVEERHTCDQNAQCRSGLCLRERGEDRGLCVHPASAGDECSLARPCEHSLRCALGRCVVPGPVGSACDDRSPCCAPGACQAGLCRAPSLSGEACGVGCSFGLVCREGRCAANLPAGARCEVEDTPGALGCSTFHRCDPLTKVCTPLGESDFP